MAVPASASGAPDPTGARLAGPNSSSISSEPDPHARAANTPPPPQPPSSSPSPNAVSISTNAPIPVTGPQCDARGLPAPASANSPPRASIPGRPPSCGSRNPSQVCSAGQCCSSEGWCGPTAFAAGVYIENGVAMNQSAAEALYCAAPQGDWRNWTPVGPCSLLGVSYPWDPTKAPPLSAPNTSPSVPTLLPPVPTTSGGQTMTSGGKDSSGNSRNGASTGGDEGLSTGTAILLGAIFGIVLASVLSAGLWWWWMRTRAQRGSTKGLRRRSLLLPPGSWEDEVAVLKRQSGQPSVAHHDESDMVPMMVPGSSQRGGSSANAAGKVNSSAATSPSPTNEYHSGPQSIPQHYHRPNHTQGYRSHQYPPQQPYPHHVVGPTRSAAASGSLGYLGTGISSKDPLLSDVQLDNARPSTPPSAIQPALLPISISSPSPFGSLFRGPSWDTNATSVPEQYPSAHQLKSPSRPITAPPQAIDMESPSLELKSPITPALLLAQAINSIDESDLGCTPRQDSQASRSLAAILNGSMSCPNLAQRPAVPAKKDSFMSSTSGSASTLHLHQHVRQTPSPDQGNQPNQYSLLGYSTYSGPRPPMPPVPESPVLFHPQLSAIALSAEGANTPSAVGSNLSARTQRTTSILSRRDSLPPGMLANLANSAGISISGSPMLNSEQPTTSQAPTPRPAPVQPTLVHSDGMASVISGSFVSAAGSDPLLDNDAPPESLLPRFTAALATYGAMPGVRIARQSFAGAEEDELDLRVGDAVMVVQIYSDAWCQGTNQRSGLSGVFPLCALDPMGEQDKVVAALLDDLADLPSIDIE
ncbi:hypothetical protein BCR44DRAFT_1431605 [Catenaria anguillulae PL171]|uniref:SH3 domain-containing protein n=1 Tax=Catenaria anguillulae PL171 TaxID=765915 RepID=A0A1Y2HQ36_9FUNG|nr:hypothetical protein BCR44DRAFT_1431605 [Catenaria anguillulae PL171]